MITTADVKIKEEKDKKVTILTSDDNKPAEFIVKGNPAKPNEQMITTSNVDQRKRELAKDLKKASDKQKRAAAKLRKDAREEEAKKKKSKPKDLSFSDSGRDE